VDNQTGDCSLHTRHLILTIKNLTINVEEELLSVCGAWRGQGGRGGGRGCHQGTTI
jgi:hypothetical protein